MERWSHAQGIYVIACSAPKRSFAPKETAHGLLSGALLDSMGANSDDLVADSRNAVDVTEWFGLAARRAGTVMGQLGLNPLNVHRSSQSKGFPLLAVER